jgi:hypothetical protein
MQGGHPVLMQKRLEGVELPLVHRAFGEADHVDGSGLLARGEQHTVQKLKIEAFLGCELEKAERFLRRPVYRLLEWPEVRRPHAQGPRQQQQVCVLGLEIRTAMTGRHLVPAGFDAGAFDAGIARERRASGGRRSDFWQHP